MTTVTGTLTTPDGNRPRAATVTITLVDQAGHPVIGFATGDTEIISSTEAEAAPDGSWAVTLTPTADIASPRGPTLYRVDETSIGGSGRYYISVPASGTHWAADLRVTLPGGASEQLVGYLPLTGGALTGPLTLTGPPEEPQEAATKAYVDAHSGGGGGGSYAHTQSTPATTWSIPHGLGYRPNVAVADTDGNQIDAAIAWPTANTVTVSFGASTAGTAYLS